MPSARRAPLALLTALALVLGLAVIPSQAPAAQASTTVPVTVTVLDPNGEPFTTGEPGEYLEVRLVPIVSGSTVTVAVGANGVATVNAAPGTHNLQLTYTGRQNVLDGWGVGFADRTGSTVYTVTADGPNSITGQFRAGGIISGSATGEDVSLTSLSVSVFRNGWPWDQGEHEYWFDAETQRYTITRLPPGNYRVLVQGSGAGAVSLVGEWIGGVLNTPMIGGLAPGGTPSQAGESVTVSSGSAVEVPPLSLERMSMIRGTITWPGTPPDFFSRSARVYLDGVYQGEISVGSGSYRILDAARFDGDWTVCVPAAARFNSYRWAESCWSPDGAASRAEAAPISAVSKTVLSGFDIDVAAGGGVYFEVLIDLDGAGGASPFPAPDAELVLYRLSADGERLDQYASTRASGFVGAGPVLPGTYAVQFVDWEHPEVGRTWLTRFGTTSTTLDIEDLITIEAGPNAEQTVVLRPYARRFDRIFGSDRFSTAVAVSRETIGDDQTPASVVYIANGLNYPDALSAGPIAAQQGGAMLMVGPTTIPASVRAELQRLAPERIVIVGGTGAVSAAVEADLRQYVDGDGTRVTRVSGADRYAVSRSLIGQSFAGQTGMTLFIATGRNYPDALAAGPAAAALGGAVLLVNGAATTIDTPTRQLIDALQPSEVVIVGGSGVVSNGIASSLVARYGENNVFRVPGTDRYSGAANLNTAVFAESTLAFVATGTSFADALAGGVLAGQLSAPLYLTLPQCIPPVTHAAMNATRSSFATIFGGTGAVSAAVERGTVCGARSSDAPASIPAPGSRAERQADAEIERLREALDRG